MLKPLAIRNSSKKMLILGQLFATLFISSHAAKASTEFISPPITYLDSDFTGLGSLPDPNTVSVSQTGPTAAVHAEDSDYIARLEGLFKVKFERNPFLMMRANNVSKTPWPSSCIFN